MTHGAGRIRVVGGSLRGRALVTPGGLAVRPTGSKVRKALFDILGRSVMESTFLDAYAGSGAIGIEAASRGARQVAFVEADPMAQAALRRNLPLVDAAGSRATVFLKDLGRALKEMGRMGLRYDIVFLDPPYAGGELDRAVRLVSSSGLLAPGAVVVAEHDASAEPPRHPGLEAYRTVRYGKTALTFHRARTSLTDPEPPSNIDARCR